MNTEAVIADRAHMARYLMATHGLFGWGFRWDNAKSRAGLCLHERRVISLSRPIAELWTEEETRETVLHEIAHALAGFEAGHGPEWQAVCARIGAKPNRCFESDALLPPARYTGTCPNGHTHRRQRLTSNTPNQSCGQCSRRYDTRYLITWTEN